MKFKKILPQFLTLLFIVLIFGFFTMNAQENMDTRGIEFGFGFLSKEASFDIQFSLIDYDGSMSYARAYLVGLLNTLLVSFIGIILCTLLGAVVGVARLSPNYLIRKTASFYIEFFRNIPLLLQIFFWYFAALRALPMPEDAPLIFGSSFMTIKGLYTPAPIWTNFDVFMISLVVALFVIYFFNKFAKKKQEEEGKQYPKFLISLGIFIILPALTFIIGGVAVISGVAVSLARLLGKCGPVDENGVPCVGNVQCDLRFGSMDDNEFNESKFKSSEQNTKQFFQNLKRLFGDFGNTIWSVYQGVLGVVGLAALPQVGLQSLLPTEMAVRLGFYPGLIGGSLGVVLVVLGRLQLLPPALATAWGRLSGWTATLLFMTMPVAQLASNFARPATLEGLSVWSSLLAMLGNALMVPRALYTRDVIWLTGSTWGCTLMGWGVMLSLFLGTKLDGTRYIDAFTFGALTATFFLYLAAVWFVDGVSALAAGYHAGWRLKAWNFHGAADEQPRTEIKKKIREASGKAE